VAGSAAVKARPIRSGALIPAGSAMVVRCLRRSRTPTRLLLRITRAMRLWWLTRSPASRSSVVILGAP
jgi:hypothetical protein